MTIDVDDAMRELLRYAMEEMRDRGLEEAAQVADDDGRALVARRIRLLQRDPALQLTDWWGTPATTQIDFIPIGA